jgi:sRNA-binding protein
LVRRSQSDVEYSITLPPHETNAPDEDMTGKEPNDDTKPQVAKQEKRESCTNLYEMLSGRISMEYVRKGLPVRMDDNAKAAIVVEMTCAAFSSPNIAVMSFARMWKKGCMRPKPCVSSDNSRS